MWTPTHSIEADAASNAARYALAVLLLTSIHHAYGAYIYNTRGVTTRCLSPESQRL